MSLLLVAGGGVALGQARADGTAFIDCSGADQVLPANDDASTSAVALPFTADFYGANYQLVFVNNNGNITFDQPLGDYTPYQLAANTPPIIAPFFADVDTRAEASALVQYGTTSYQGHSAFCVDWRGVGGAGVGYYNQRSDKLNSFQLLLVSRTDVGAGDFDIYFNYGSIQWETGDASGGVDGLGGTSAGAGYSAGDNNPSHFFQIPGSLENGAFLDSSPSGLARVSRNSLVSGRQVFEIRNGQGAGTAEITGTVTGPGGGPLTGAPVQVCPPSQPDGQQGRCVLNTLTTSEGRYDATGLPAGAFTVRAFPPAGSNLNPAVVNVPTLAAGETAQVDVALTAPQPPPADTTVTMIGTGQNGLPVVNWRDDLLLQTTGCTGGSAAYTVTLADGRVVRSGALTESTAGNYTATIPSLYPDHGDAHVLVTIDCPEGTPDQTVPFDIYIDPSGFVRTIAGDPIPGATVTLMRSDSVDGPFTSVPDGSAVMSPVNRTNPDATGTDGHFGWDVVTGYYRVTATAPGCHTPGDPTTAAATSDTLTIPPAVFDLDLRLACDGPTTNQPPVVDAGPDMTGQVGRPIPLDGAVTDDGPVDITWTVPDAAPCTVADPGSAATSVTCTAAGSYMLTLTADDQANAPVSDTTTITVQSASPPGSRTCGGRTPTIVGTRGNDVLKGTPGDDVIDGRGGHDEIFGLGGNDIICGGAAGDQIYGGSGNDVIYGNAGDDVLFGQAGDDTLVGGTGNDRLSGGDGRDSMSGGMGDDILRGQAGEDRLNGDAGNDQLYGGDGNDSLFGGSGADALFGEAGNDLLNGGVDRDRCADDRATTRYVSCEVTR